MNGKLQTGIAPRRAELIQARFALRVAASLSELQARAGNPDIDERLRFARNQALTCAQQARRLAPSPTVAETAMTTARGSSAILARGPDSTPWWLRLGAMVPLALLLAGLLLIDHRYTQSQIDAAIELDAAILGDDLPPEAYRDQGFVEFLRSARS